MEIFVVMGKFVKDGKWLSFGPVDSSEKSVEDAREHAEEYAADLLGGNQKYLSETRVDRFVKAETIFVAEKQREQR